MCECAAKCVDVASWPASRSTDAFLGLVARLPWSDSNNCLAPDANTGVPPVNIADPFGRGGSPDPTTFALFPSSMQVACATSPDGNAAFLTLSEGLVEISRFYAFRNLASAICVGESIFLGTARGSMSQWKQHNCISVSSNGPERRALCRS
ncbi:unnamed protein product [Symbiodinium microadriaticum]|nr:unnamed protein product [Symbiodinium microadriaticum]